MQNQFDEFSRNCGEILRFGSQIESILEIFISDYFINTYKNSRKHLLNDLIFRLNFERKFQIFKQICKGEEIPSSKIKKIEENVEIVKRIRNRVAHESPVILSSGEGIRLFPKKSRFSNHEIMDINLKLVKDIEEITASVIHEIDFINRELSNPNRTKKSKIF